MAKYNIDDFRVGEKVYHLSNTNLSMVITEINKSLNEVCCRWVDKSGKVQKVEFLPEELGKDSDFGPMLRMVQILP